MKMMKTNELKSGIMKKVLRLNPIILAAIILLLARGCTKEEPESSTQPATNLSKTGATLNGTVNPNGLTTTVTFEYGTSTSYESSVIAAQSPVNGNGITDVSAEISGLTLGTIYHFRVKAENSHWTVYSRDNEFEYGYPPSATTLGVTNSKSTGVRLNGIVNPGGISTTVTFEYGTTTSNDSTITAYQSPVTGNSIVDVSADISGLEPCTTYHFRVKAENGFATSCGPDTTFYTSELLTLTTTSISGITATTAISGGNIISEGCSDITDRGIESYRIILGIRGRGMSGMIRTDWKRTHDGTGTGSFTSNLTGLLPSTTYYVLSYATNSAGTAYGNTISFKTSSSGK
jgi:hypothetical protein